MMKTRRLPRIQKGFSLIEVLITMVVVAIGLLGFAGLQTYALKSNRLALQRSLATMNAYSILDSMRVNKAQAANSDYNQAYGGVAAAGTVAGDDLSAWNSAIASNLPSGQGAITVVGTAVSISIRWKEGTQANDPYIVWSTQTSL